MDDFGKVVKGLECCLEKGKDGFPVCEKCPYQDDSGTCPNLDDMHRDALALIRPRVLTAEELGGIEEGDTVYLEMRECSYPGNEAHTGWALLEEHKKTLYGEWLYSFAVITRTKITNHPYTLLPLYEREYGNEWRIWSGEPTDVQRKAVKWDG